MPVLFGALFGRALGTVLGRVVWSHAFLTVVVWYGLSAAAFFVARANLGEAAGIPAAVLVPAALLAWTLHRPAESRVKLWLFDGFYVWCRLGVFWSAVVSAAGLFAAAGVITVWLSLVWPHLLVGLGCWLLQRALAEWLRRSRGRVTDAGQDGANRPAADEVSNVGGRETSS